MEKYIRAEMEVVKFDVEDVITTSGETETTLWQPDCPPRAAHGLIRHRPVIHRGPPARSQNGFRAGDRPGKGRKKHMKLKDGFVTREMYGEHLMVSTDGAFNGLVRSNAAAAFIVECLAEETTEQEIVQKMLAKYDAPTEILEEDVKKILNTLRDVDALEE